MKYKKPSDAQIRRARLAQLQNQRFATASAIEEERECIHCGCTNDHACDGGCYWVSNDPPICSRCA